jgi:hypothetical protein
MATILQTTRLRNPEDRNLKSVLTLMREMHLLGYGVPTTVNITPCSPLNVCRRFGGTCPILNGRKCLLSASCSCLVWLASSPKRDVPPKRRLIFNVLNGVISQNVKTLHLHVKICITEFLDFEHYICFERTWRFGNCCFLRIPWMKFRDVIFVCLILALICIMQSQYV